ncbi:uncharacterized protein EAF01_008960 [Botrytis porri]|uniref:C2H2-type domain-containing protein n=1 Tax=Botrytis porri TaxID=87229 RepID=A0A4Z1KAM9_9HELO|nr:uncharacterized protein EAF01_008960 [Botrytis porri]KAF7897994.1 hypothetical protein EAF01_008960 [Botrytis porri]TGO83183.1 hypothetical protein BPOR_0689g00010 [Botrytis porri]
MEDDFLKPGANETCRYRQFDPKLKEHALKLESYARTDGKGSLDAPKRTLVHRNVYQKHNITHKLRLVDGMAVPNEDIEKYLTPPTNIKKLFSQAPIALIRQPWDSLTPREREKAYGELSKYDFQQIWSHHLKELGPKPTQVATDALKNQLRENLPDYWRSWHKSYSYELPRAFKMLQERRRFLDRGEIPEHVDSISKSEEAPIKLKNAPKKLEKPSEKIHIPSFTHLRWSASLESVASSPKLAIAPMYESEIPAQSKPAQTVAGMSSVVKRSTKTESSGASILGRVSASITGVLGYDNEKVLYLECGKDFVNHQAFLDHFKHAHSRNFGDLNQAMMDEMSPNTVSDSLPLADTTTLSPEVPAPNSLNTSSSTSSHVEHEANNYLTKPATNTSSNSKSSSTRCSIPQSFTKPILKAPKRPAGVADMSGSKRPSSKMRRLSPVCVKSSVSERDNLTDPMDLDNPRMIVVADPAESGAGSTSFLTTVVSSSLQTASLSVSSSEKARDKISPTVQEVDTSAELPAAVKLDIETPSDIEPSTRLGASMPTIITETTASSTDTDKKPQLKVEEDLKISEAEIKSSEEEVRRRETEHEDAIRIAEARMELHKVRRKIETLRSGNL